jgi:hypothetical protein
MNKTPPTDELIMNVVATSGIMTAILLGAAALHLVGLT